MAVFPIGAAVEVISAMRLMEVVEVGERGLRCRPVGKKDAEWYPLSDIRKDDPRPLLCGGLHAARHGGRQLAA